MPQMSPLNWLNLYLYFLIIFFLHQIILYYFYLYPPSKKINNMNKSHMNSFIWMW